MAYDTQGASVGAAGHFASRITAALITAGAVTQEDALDVFGEILTATFEMSENLKGTLPEQEAPAKKAWGGKSYPKKGGGGGGNSDPGSVDFRSGKFAGKTIAEVFADDEGDGPGYLEWCTNNLKNDFMVGRINAYLETV